MQTAFKPFSPKQKLALRWWALPQYRDYDAIICDGAVRSGKTVCMSLGFVCWATTCFQGTAFALCGKTITALRRNVVTPLLQTLQTLGAAATMWKLLSATTAIGFICSAEKMKAVQP